jgi:polyisoprenoid-binding protein YceI
MTDQGSAPSATSASTSTEGPATPLPGVYRVDPDQTVIRFRARSMFGLVPVKGTFTVGQGEFTVAEDVAASTIDVSVLAESFASGNPKRDEHIRSADYLEASAHREIVFRSASVQQGSETAAPGELTVRGVTQPCVLTITAVTGDDKTVTAQAVTTVDRYAFGLTKQKGMVGRQTILEIEVVAVRESELAQAEASSEAPVEAAEETSVEAPVQPLAESSAEASVETTAETPLEVPAEPLAETPAEAGAGAETPAPAEAEAKVEAEAASEPSAEPVAETPAESSSPDHPLS